MFRHLTTPKMTVDFFGLGGHFGSLSGLRNHFFQKISSEMDSACQKTYISIPCTTENDNWFFGLGGRFRGLSGLRFYFFLKITSEMDSACQKTYISTPLITENDNWLIGLRGRFRGLGHLRYYSFTKNNFINGFSIRKNIYFNSSHHKKW